MIDNFTALYERAASPGRVMSPFITGHLVVEFMLRKLVSIYDPALESLADGLTTLRLIRLAHDIGTITSQQRDVLVHINKIRNRFAHQLTYEPEIAELKTLYTNARSAFTDLTDGLLQGFEVLESGLSLDQIQSKHDWFIPEFFIQISYDLHQAYIDRGGDEETF